LTLFERFLGVTCGCKWVRKEKGETVTYILLYSQEQNKFKVHPPSLYHLIKPMISKLAVKLRRLALILRSALSEIKENDKDLAFAEYPSTSK